MTKNCSIQKQIILLHRNYWQQSCIASQLLGPIAVALQLLGILAIASQLSFQKNVITSQLFGRLYCIAINFFRELPRIAIITASQLLGTREYVVPVASRATDCLQLLRRSHKTVRRLMRLHYKSHSVLPALRQAGRYHLQYLMLSSVSYVRLAVSIYSI